MSRILFKPALVLFPVFSIFGLSAQTVATATLKDAYKDAFKVGCSVNNSVVSGRDAASQKLVAQHFNAITPENEMKAEVLNPRPGEW